MNQLHTVLCAFLFVSCLFGQNATLRGHVTDESGAIVPGAIVKIIGPGGSKTATADVQGSYSFAALAPGSYSLEAAAPRLVQPPTRISLSAGTRVFDCVLKVESTTDKITVQEDAGAALSLESSNNASAVTLRGQDLEALSDNPDDLQADLQALA